MSLANLCAKIATRDELDRLLIEQAAEADRLRATLEEVSELAAWHCDDEADEGDDSPRDMTAHVNGIIRQKCAKALTPNAELCSESASPQR